MIIQFDCEYCGRGQTAPDSKAGTTQPCRYCGGDCQVPRAAPPSPAAGGPVGSPIGSPVGGPVGGGADPTAFHPPPQGGSAFGPPPAAFQPAQGGFSPPPPAFGQPQGEPEVYKRPDANPYHVQMSGISGAMAGAGDEHPGEKLATTAIVLAALGWFLCPVFSLVAIIPALRSRSLSVGAGLKTPITAYIALALGVLPIIGFGFFALLMAIAGANSI